MRDTETRSGGAARLSWRWTSIGALALVLTAIAIYQPWDPQPIGIVDYGEYAPFLTHATSLGDRFTSVARYYLDEHGRINVVVYALIALKWSWFGDFAPAWFWARFATMLGVIALVVALLRRLGCDRLGAAMGAALFVGAGTAAQSWFVLNIGEPAGSALLFAAAWLAAGHRTAARWGWRAAAIAVLCVLALLTKEMLALLLPLVVVLATCHVGGGRFAPPRRDARSVALVAVLLLATAAVAAAVLVAARIGSSVAYVSPYSAANATGYKFLRLFCAVLFPIWPTRPADVPVALVGNLSFLLAVWLGLRADLYDRMERRNALARLGVALLPVLTGLVLYLPWPNFAGFYGFPMLVGPALLVGWSVTARPWRPERARRVVAGAIGLTLLLTLPLAHRDARAAAAEARVEERLASVLSLRAAGRPLFFLTSVVRPDVWGTHGRSLSRFAATMGLALAPGRDVPCAAHEAGSEAGGIRVTLSNDCGLPPERGVSVVERYRYFDVRTLAVRVDSVEAVILGL